MTSASNSSIVSWLSGALPDEWNRPDPAAITVDRDEITITVSIDPPVGTESGSDVDAGEARAGRIAMFREDTRDRRISIAREAERRFERKVAWAVSCGETTELFTHLAAPVMTRLRQRERIVLDTLIEANVARSRSEALAWCVRLVGEHTEEWLADLRRAVDDVDRVRATGPDVTS